MSAVSVRSGALSNAFWTLWLVAATAATFPLLLWHIQYFRHPGAQFLPMLLIATGILAAGLPLYHRLRQRGLWRYEPAILAGLPIAAGLIYQTRALLVTACVFVSAYAFGRWVVRSLRLTLKSPAEEIAVAAGIGLGALACAMFVLGLAGGYYPLVFALGLGVICVVFGREIPALWTALRALGRDWAECEEMRSGLGTLLVVFAAPFVLSGAMVVLAPSVAFDVVRHHLAEVKVYSGQHALHVLPFLDASYYPQNTELLMTLAYGLGGQPAAQMIAPLFFGLTLFMTFELARRCGASPLASLAAVIFAGTIPFLHWTGSVAKNDGALAFFVLCALYAYLRWQESADFTWIRMGVFFLAMAAGVKQIALFALLPLAAFYALAAWRQPRRLPALASLATLFALFGLFWYARTFWLTGDPLYPWSLRSAVSTTSPERSGSAVVLRYIRMPWRLHFAGQTRFASPLANPLGMFFPLFGAVWLVTRRVGKNPAERTCLIFSGAYLLYWSATIPDPRFAIAPILLLAASTSGRLVAYYDASRGWTRRVILGAGAYCLCFALLATLILEVNAPQLRLFAGKLDSSGYLREALVTFPSLEYLKTQAAPGDRVLSVQNGSAAYAPDPAAFDCVFPPAGVLNWPEVEDRLRQANYRFLIAPSAWTSTLPTRLSGAVLLYQDGAFSVYRLPASSSEKIGGGRN